ncbi:MAG: hypothetical protein QXE52_08115 [Candidatus Caldarchaeum sp.]
MYRGTLVQLIATAISALKRGDEDRGLTLIKMAEDFLPHGWTIVSHASKPDEIIIWASLSRYDEFGFEQEDYSCSVVVKPSFIWGVDVEIKGSDEDELCEEAVAQMVYSLMTEEVKDAAA